MSKKASECQVGGMHYRGLAIQPIEFAIKNNLGPCETSVLKYICRHNLKGGKEDIHKAIHYCKLILQHVYGELPEAEACPVKTTVTSDGLAETQEMATPYQPFRKQLTPTT